MDSLYDTDCPDPTDVEDGSEIDPGGKEANAGEGVEEAFDMDELEILARWRREWMQASKKKKQIIFHAIYQEVCELEKHNAASDVELEALQEDLVEDAPMWAKTSDYSVVWLQVYHDRICQKLLRMQEADGEESGKSWIDLYQQALTAFMQEELTEEQLDATYEIVEEWNGPQGPSAEVKAHMDFNDEIYDGNPFNDIHTLDGTWRDYVGVAFEEQGEPEEDMELIQERPTVKSRKVDPVSLVTAEDGDIWVGPIVGLSHTTKQQMVHGFLTAHYRKACRNPSTAVPFKRLGQHQHEMIVPRHLPPQFTFTVDPSHMHVAAVVELLDFWHARQESHPEDVFTFQKWLDSSGDLQDPITRNEHPLLIARSRRSWSRMPGRPSSRPKVPAQGVTSRHGKGKSRASERTSTELSNIGMDYSDMETCDEFELSTDDSRCGMTNTPCGSTDGQSESGPSIPAESGISRTHSHLYNVPQSGSQPKGVRPRDDSDWTGADRQDANTIVLQPVETDKMSFKSARRH
ncbi:hypothetical protein EDD15DRAFT_2372781 [Pisolithus albus]|nr:hypothetical protein EDD15DRAFT_2372781 [Pisolithus albus]